MTTPADENTCRQTDSRVLALNAADALVLTLLLKFGISDTCSTRKSGTYASMLQKLDPAHAPPIRGSLEVSTRHLRLEDRRFLDDATSRHAMHSTAAMRGVFGWLIYAHHERTCSGLSDTLWTIMVRARDLGCDYVLFDLDAPIHPELPVFDEDTGERVFEVSREGSSR
jgi:hypothetical protein